MGKDVCALCKEEKDALKKNTHYLTDSIIRSCLNLDGSGNSQEGLYFDISNTTPFIDFNFQRNTSVAKLEEALGREATEEERARAFEIPFSVDNVFCKECEDRFTKIETEFMATILPRFRAENLDDVSRISIKEAQSIRLFIYIQIFRSSVCEPIFKPNEKSIEELRKTILSADILTNEDIHHFPLHVCYLQTTGGAKEYTNNLVGFSNDRNPHIIFFNDFVIQFFDSAEDVKFTEIFGLMGEDEFTSTINLKEQVFTILVRSNMQRQSFLAYYTAKEKVDNAIEILRYKFSELWKKVFVFHPSERLWEEYFAGLIGSDVSKILKFTPSEVVKYTRDFVIGKLQQ